MIEVDGITLREVMFRFVDPDDTPGDARHVAVHVLDDVLDTAASTLHVHGRITVPLADGAGSIDLIAGTPCRYVVAVEPPRAVTVPAGGPVNYEELPEG